MTRFCTRATVVAVALVSFLLLGCENKLTRDNYDRVQVGMSLMQVTDILGEGEKQEKGGASKLAQDMLGLELSGATARQNANQAKQGLKDLTGPDGTTPRVATNTPTRVPSGTQRVPVRDVYLWRTDKIEISVQFQDEKVVDKNQFGLD
jgi:outer membrane murein-binding lipoprotein Lpp